jgi:hypothetical protein
MSQSRPQFPQNAYQQKYPLLSKIVFGAVLGLYCYPSPLKMPDIIKKAE